MTNKMMNFISQALKPIRNRVYTMISRAVIEAVNDAGGMQVLKLNLLADETRNAIERFQNFGFSSNPPANSEALALAVGGNRDHLVVVACDDRATRIKNLVSGESAVYTNDGTIIHLKQGGIVDIIAATKVNVNCPLVEFSGDVEIRGNLDVDGIISSLTKVTAPLVEAANFTGLSGGTMSSNVDFSTTGNVTGGGTNLASVKSTFNSHTHDENGTGGGTTDPPSTPL